MRTIQMLRRLCVGVHAIMFVFRIFDYSSIMMGLFVNILLLTQYIQPVLFS